MTQPWDENLVWAKYHISTAQRLFENFNNYETKSFLSSTITELAISTSYFIETLLTYLKFKHQINIPTSPKDRIKTIIKNTNLLNINQEQIKTLTTILNIKKAQKKSPIQFLKQNKILLLDNNQYKILTYEKLNQLILNLNNIIKKINYL